HGLLDLADAPRRGARLARGRMDASRRGTPAPRGEVPRREADQAPDQKHDDAVARGPLRLRPGRSFHARILSKKKRAVLRRPVVDPFFGRLSETGPGSGPTWRAPCRPAARLPSRRAR